MPYAEFEIQESSSGTPAKKRFGLKRGWSASDPESFKRSVEVQIEHSTTMDDVIMSTEDDVNLLVDIAEMASAMLKEFLETPEGVHGP